MTGICGVQADSARADAGIDVESLINIIKIIKIKGSRVDVDTPLADRIRNEAAPEINIIRNKCHRPRRAKRTGENLGVLRPESKEALIINNKSVVAQRAWRQNAAFDQTAKCLRTQ